jgi:nucleoside-diphosphate-sugar epimerase
MTQMGGATVTGDARGTVLLTGAAGRIGRVVANLLPRDGWTVRGFDLVDGDDLRDAAAVDAATAGCVAVVHAGAIPHDTSGTPEEIVATNVLGTWHVLLAAERHRVRRVVTFSSIQVFGCTEGEGEPAYLPLDDDHPLLASRPYGMSKVLVEQMCEAWTARTGITTIVLRPSATLDDERFARFDPREVDFGTYVHVDDVADAVARSLRVPVRDHLRVVLSAAGDVDASRASDELGWEPVRRLTRRQQLRRTLRR